MTIAASRLTTTSLNPMEIEMVKKPTKEALTKQAKALEELSEMEELVRLHMYEGPDALLERVSAVAKPKLSSGKGWNEITLCGIMARSTVSGKPLWENWLHAARRQLATLKHANGNGVLA